MLCFFVAVLFVLFYMQMFVLCMWGAALLCLLLQKCSHHKGQAWSSSRQCPINEASLHQSLGLLWSPAVKSCHTSVSRSDAIDFGKSKAQLLVSVPWQALPTLCHFFSYHLLLETEEGHTQVKLGLRTASKLLPAVLVTFHAEIMSVEAVSYRSKDF